MHPIACSHPLAKLATFLRTSALLVPLAAVLMAAPAPARGAAADPAGTRLAGREIYAAACAACHGMDGTGAPPSTLAFDTPMPDFTDCSFASREPDADWVAVTHQGGPARGFAPMMPAFGDTLDVDQIQRAVDHVRGFCGDDAWPRGDLNLPRAMFTEKAFPEDEAVLTVGATVEGRTEIPVELLYGKRLGVRNQLEVAVPFTLRERLDPASADGSATDGWEAGLGDVALGLKRVMWHSLAAGSIVTATAEFVLPTGDEDDGFGSGTTVFEPFLTYGQILPADLGFLQFQGGAELPFDRDRTGEEGFWRGVWGRTFEQAHWGRAWSPMVELLGSRELVSGADVQWDLAPQVQVSLNTRQHVLGNLAVRLPLTDAADRPTEIYLYILWDWFDGGLTEGW
ncbi:MAG: c-type cytochrome [Candidatus Krumholzibacteriia bacterium]